MKTNRALLSRLATGALALLLASCMSVAPGIYLERDPERLGRATGRQDALHGLSSNYKRHLRELDPSADEEDFEDAYNDAYDDAENERDDYADASGNTYWRW